MDLLEMVLWPEEILSTPADPIPEEDFGYENIGLFASHLLKTMHSQKGLGLAAPQVGAAKQVFAMTFPENPNLKAEIVINPTIELKGQEVVGREGCLSLPGIFEQVRRFSNVTLHYRTVTGESKVALLSGMDARVAQHEYDHLQGIMFFDRLSRQMKKQVLRQWQSANVRNVTTSRRS